VSYNLVSLGYNGRTRTSEVHEGVHIEGKWNPPGPGIPKLQKRGVDAKLKGHAVYDQKAKKFVSFNLLVVTKRWGEMFTTHVPGFLILVLLRWELYSD